MCKCPSIQLIKRIQLNINTASTYIYKSHCYGNFPFYHSARPVQMIDILVVGKMVKKNCSINYAENTPINWKERENEFHTTVL